ncbi:MAG TPA: DUF6192 family protein [Geminicoccaceae bacterium]|nr:DUF6192 family protein [Geminicoccaceae bacterium]
MIPRQRRDFENHGVHEVLRSYAHEIGISERTLTTYRYVAGAWPENKRNLDVAFSVHKTLAAQPNRFKKIHNPPVDPVSGERRWTLNEALRAASRTPQHPRTSQERVDRVRDLVRDEEDAVSAVKDILRRPEVVKGVLSDPSSRHILRTASQPQYFAVDEPDEGTDDEYDQVDAQPAPSRRTSPAYYSQRPREVLELIGVCTTFYTQMQRMIPSMNVADYAEDTGETLLASLERVRAAAEWAETVINTGDTTMEEGLAKLLDGEP